MKLLLLDKAQLALDHRLSTGLLPAGVTVTRASAGQRVGANGLLQSVAADLPRFDYDPVSLGVRGLLIEPQRTNLIQQSALLSGWYAESGGTLSYPASPAAPDGGSSALLQGAGGSGVCMNRYAMTNLTVGTTYSASCYARMGTSRYAYLRVNDNSLQYGILFDLQTGSVVGALTGSAAVAACGISPAGGGWFRLWLSFTSAGTGGYYVLRPGIADSSSLAFLSGAVSGNGQFFGAQLEAGARPSSYIPTTASNVTRAADAYGLNVPAGVASLALRYDDGFVQKLSVSSGAYSVTPAQDRFCVTRLFSL